MAYEYLDKTGVNHLIDTIDSKLSTKVETDDILELAYPVGSIFMSTNNVSPKTFIGGEWTEIEDVFFISASVNSEAVYMWKRIK